MQRAAIWNWYLLFAVMHLYIYVYIFFIASVHSFFFIYFFFFFKDGIYKSTDWSTIPPCPTSLTCFFNRGDTEVTNSSKILCLMFVYVLFNVNLCTRMILRFLNNLWFDDLRAE